MPRLDFWYEFASTYSYLAAMRIAPLAKEAGVEVRWRPFLLGPIFKAQGMETSPFNIYPLKGKYMWRDMARWSELLKLPEFVPPKTFPAHPLGASRVALALDDAARPDFTRAIYQAEFNEGKDIADAATIGEVLKKLGFDAAAVIAKGGEPAVKDKLRANTEEAAKLDIFGAPNFVTADGELFWGNDRLEQALAWARKH
ncbi:MAG TPA: 2-hydroxychromene-2-carboxylate isomerase [Xanthobacteraceae bacterium]|nr:2-hydroxychromene-2-carboxylate isomerase [Xanthobacteraceae bacterium]